MIVYNRAVPGRTIKLVIFDLDGTLVDSRVDLANSINAMLRHNGRPELPCEVISSYIGDGAPMLVRRALGDPDEPEVVAAALEYFMQYYREHKLDNTYVYEGVHEALSSIQSGSNGTTLNSTSTGGLNRNPGRKLAVLSNKPVNPSRQIIQALGLAEFFFQVYGGNSFHTKKPDPAGVEALLSEARVQPQEALLVGDSDIDVVTARNAGIWSCGVSYGFAPHTFAAAPPDVLVDEPGEWPRLFA